MQKSNRIAVPRGSDGLALIGRTLNDLRGIRFVEGEDGGAPAADETPTGETAPDTGTHDESVCAAKITQLETDNAALIAENEALVAAHATELTAQKAANYDLLQQIPSDAPATAAIVDDESDVDIDDLFTKKED